MTQTSVGALPSHRLFNATVTGAFWNSSRSHRLNHTLQEEPLACWQSHSERTFSRLPLGFTSGSLTLQVVEELFAYWKLEDADDTLEELEEALIVRFLPGLSPPDVPSLTQLC